MPGQGRTIGTILLVVAALAFLIAAALLLAQVANEETTVTGAILGILIVSVVLVLPLGGAGVYLMSKGREERAEFAEIAKQKKILNMVLTQGKVTLSEVTLELQTTRDQVDDYVRDLVGKGLFSGAINWQDGVLYSKQASQLKADQKCPNCGGKVELAGKSVIKCPFCGSEIFLSS
jgi:DNA-directed RNA polymerase subunit RPC12/RpoP